MPDIRDRLTGRVIFGALLIGLGVLFTLDNLGWVSAGEALLWWPLVLVAYGLARLTGFCCRTNAVAGLLFTGGGAWLLLHNLGYVERNPWDFWPVILIVIGGAMVARALRGGAPPFEVGAIPPDEIRPEWRERLRDRVRGGVRAGWAAGRGATAEHDRPDAGASGSGPEDTSSALNAFALWSGASRKIVSDHFRGGEVTAIMGGHDIDLRGARAAGGTATVDVLVLMGGVDFYVPDDWKVTVKALPIMAGIEDLSKVPAGEIRGHLILRGIVLMGGVEIKN